VHALAQLSPTCSSAAAVAAGYIVYSHDHRGHGATAQAAGVARLAMLQKELEGYTLSELQKRGVAEGVEPARLEAAVDSKQPVAALVSLLVTTENARESANDAGHFADEGGWEAAVEDAHAVTEMIRQREQRGINVVLVGHSLGALLGRHYVARYGAELAAFVAMGSGAVPHSDASSAPASSAKVAALVAASGPRTRLPMAELFAPFNAATVAASGGAQHSEHDWLSRRPEVGLSYENDPLCCVTQWNDHMTAALALDIREGSAAASTPALVARIPAELPILVLNGQRDPVIANRALEGADALDGSGHGHLVRLLREEAGTLSLRDVLYPEARHELLHELPEVRGDAIAEVVAFVQVSVCVAACTQHGRPRACTDLHRLCLSLTAWHHLASS
jgi:alpha-beta hydrolase superfamily lysophospholipase